MFALWGAALGLVLGVLGGIGVIGQTPIVRLGGAEAGTAIGAVLGGLLGAVGGFVGAFAFLLFVHPVQGAVTVLSGVVCAVVVAIAAFERLGLRLRGYRRLSRDEVRRLAPLVKEVADGMQLPTLPRFAMDDSLVPSAWAHMRTIVLTAGLFNTLDDAEMRGVLAHELQHWRMGDSVGLVMVWAAALPVALTYNLGMYLARGPARPLQGGGNAPARTVLALVGWFFLWPAWIITTFLIRPLIGARQRRYEYQADAVPRLLGYGLDFANALRKMHAFEAGRTGWEEALAGNHPPLELRLEALLARQPDDAQYQEDDLHGPTWAEVRRMLTCLWHRPAAPDGKTP